MSGSILDLSKEAPPKNLVTEVCIVGSGCGGGTAAWDLAVAGKEVVVLEEGGDYTGRALNQRDGPMYDQLYQDRGGRSTKDLSITILQGKVLGGGGVINACDVVPIPESVLDFWQRKFGLDDFAPEKMRPYTQRALSDLETNDIREDQVNRANQKVREGAEKLGMAGHVMRHNRVGCMGLGTCYIGCPNDAKRNPRFVAIPHSIEAGARYFVRSRVVRIERADQELKRLVVKTLDPKGYHEEKTFTIDAKVVILAANPIGSAQLLLRSGIGNEHVGRHLSLQPQLPIMASFKETIEGFYGIPQSYAVHEYEVEDDPEHGLWGFRIEPVMGTPGIVASLVPFSGHEGKRRMTQYANIAASLLLTPDDPSGTVGLTPSGRPLIDYDHLENHKSRLRDAVRAATRIYLAAGATEVLLPNARPLIFRTEKDLAQVDDLLFPPASAPMISAHQQGGVRFSNSPKDGASKPNGEVWGTKDVYVFDSSGYPSSSSSHTMTPIIATSHYLSDQLIAALG